MKKPQSLFLAASLTLAIFVTGCNVAQSEKVATVNGTEITKAQYDTEYKDIARTAGIPDINNNPIEDPKQKELLENYLKAMTINKLVSQALVKAVADKQGITVSDEDVTAFKTKLFQKDKMKTEFQEYLKKNNLQEADFDRSIREILLMDKFIAKNAGSEVTVNDSEIQKLYQTHQAELKVPERYKVKLILVEANVAKMKKEARLKNPTISDEALQKEVDAQLAPLKAKVDDLVQKIKANPGSFAELAKANSDDKVTAASGGEVGFVNRGTEVDPQMWSGLQKAPIGKPAVIQNPRGFHIVLVESHEPEKNLSFAGSRDLLRSKIEDYKKQNWLQSWLLKEQGNAKISIEPKYKPEMPPGSSPTGMPMEGGSGQAPATPAQQAPASR